MPIICLGPICFPIWGLLPVALLFLKQMWSRISVWLGMTPAPADTSALLAAALESLSQDASLSPKTVAVKSLAQLENLKSSSKLKDEALVVKFGAEWCKPCKTIEPVFHQLSASPDATFCTVDVDQADAGLKEIAASLPTFVVYRNKKEVQRLVGADEGNLFALLQATGLFESVGSDGEIKRKEALDFNNWNDSGTCKT